MTMIKKCANYWIFLAIILHTIIFFSTIFGILYKLRVLMVDSIHQNTDPVVIFSFLESKPMGHF